MEKRGNESHITFSSSIVKDQGPPCISHLQPARYKKTKPKRDNANCTSQGFESHPFRRDPLFSSPLLFWSRGSLPTQLSNVQQRGCKPPVDHPLRR